MNKLKQLRMDAGLTQGELARMTGYGVQHISNIESDRVKACSRFCQIMAITLCCDYQELKQAIGK